MISEASRREARGSQYFMMVFICSSNEPEGNPKTHEKKGKYLPVVQFFKENPAKPSLQRAQN